MSKPILFLCSSHLSFEKDALYYLKDIGSVLNLADPRTTEEDAKRFIDKAFIVVDMKDPEQVKKLRFINYDNVTRVALLRKFESSSEDWVEKAKPDFILKQFDFVKECKRVDELLNFIRHLSSYKQPAGNIVFYLKKLAFLFSCFKSD